MGLQCVLEQQPSQPTLCLRAHAPVAQMPALLGRAFSEIMALLESQGQQPAGMPYVAYRNMDATHPDLDLEIGFPVARPLAGRGEIEPGTLPGGTWAATLHVGPYDQIGPAWDALQQFVKDSGRKSRGVGYEFYFDGPDTPPEKTRTRIMFPLEG